MIESTVEEGLDIAEIRINYSKNNSGLCVGAAWDYKKDHLIFQIGSDGDEPYLILNFNKDQLELIAGILGDWAKEKNNG